jgi:hypothetical protein
VHCTIERQRGWRGSQSCSPEGGAGTSTEDRQSTVVAGEGEQSARGQRETRDREEMPGLGREQGKRFFKNELWAHRTVYSACPVHTGQRTVAVR